MNYKSNIYVAGHNGLVGSAIIRELKKRGYKKIITASRNNLDLINQEKVLKFLKKKKTKLYYYSCCEGWRDIFKQQI